MSGAKGPRPGLLLLRTEASDSSGADPAGGDLVLDKPVRSAVLLAALPQVAATGRAQQPTTVPPRILVVDQRSVSQMVTGGMVRHLGYEVEVAADEAGALTAVARGGFAAVLLDCPSAEALQCPAAAAIRRLEGERGHTPLVALVAAGGTADAGWCREAGVDGVVTRPVSLQGLDDALGTWTRSAAGRIVDRNS